MCASVRVCTYVCACVHMHVITCVCVCVDKMASKGEQLVKGKMQNMIKLTSGAKSAIWSFSRSKAACDTNMGNEAFLTPSFLISESKKSTQKKKQRKENLDNVSCLRTYIYFNRRRVHSTMIVVEYSTNQLYVTLKTISCHSTFDELPDAVRPWTDDITARHVVVLDHLRLCDHLCNTQ